MPKDPNNMTFLEHLEELRSVLIACIAGFAVAAAGSIVFYRQIFDALRWPLERVLADNPEFAGDGGNGLASLHFMDPFSILVYIALLGGFVLASPVILYKVGAFVLPALSSGEQKKLLPVVSAASGLFLAGAACAFFIFAPLSIRFMYFFSGTLGLSVNWLAADYYSFIVLITLFTGLLFEFPLVVIALQYFEIVSTKSLLAQWRYVIAGILIAVAFVSPIGDPVALLALTGLLFALYLAAVLVGDKICKGKNKAVPEDDGNGISDDRGNDVSGGNGKNETRGNDDPPIDENGDLRSLD